MGGNLITKGYNMVHLAFIAMHPTGVWVHVMFMHPAHLSPSVLSADVGRS